jgi:hypothetical protein
MKSGTSNRTRVKLRLVPMSTAKPRPSEFPLMELGKGARRGLVALRVLLVAMTLVATYTFIHRLRA